MTKRQARNLKPGDHVSNGRKLGKVANTSPSYITINWDNGERTVVRVEDMKDWVRRIKR